MRSRVKVLCIALTASGCGGAATGDVATVAGQALPQDRLASYMAQTASPGNSLALADGIAEGWLDLALVSEAAARGMDAADTTLLRQALAPFVRTEHLRRLQNALATARPPLTEEELERAFEGDSLRLYQQVLVRIRNRANVLMVQSARARADSILALARAGAPFDRLAMELSEGPTARTGGYLAVATRREVTPVFRDSLWALEPGGVSPVLPVDEGFQILRRPPLDEVHNQFAGHLLRTAGATADSLLADSLAAAHGLTILPVTAARMRAMLTNPDSLAADSAWIVAFDDGGVAPGEAWLWLAALPDRVRLSLARGSDADLEVAARSVARDELLYRMARGRGIDVELADLGDLRTDFVTGAAPVFAMFASADTPRRQEMVDSIVGSVLSGRPGPQLPAGLAPALRRTIAHSLDRRALAEVARRAPIRGRGDSLAARS